MKEIRTNTAITKQVNKLSRLRENIKNLKAIEKEVVKTIKAYLGDSDVLVNVHGDPLVKFARETSYRLNSKQLKDEYPEAYTDCSYSTVSRKFVTVKKDKKS